MNTSYFAKFRGDNGVSIAVKSPPGFKGSSYRALFPHWSFFNDYKKTKDEAVYTSAYHALVLAKLDPHKVYADLKNYTLLCWEKSGSFCHRRLVAEWLEKELGVYIPEF